MANHTLLDCVNQTLMRANWIDTANVGLLSSLTYSPLQHEIDICVQVVNEGVDELYNSTDISLPLEGAESSITLATGTREYSLASNLVVLTWPIVNRVNNQYLTQWQGTYNDFLLIDPQQNQSGLPILAMISPITGFLRVDRAPDSTNNGQVYTYEYQKDTGMVNSTDTVPFNNTVFRSMVPVWVQLLKRELRNEFDQNLYDIALGRASRTVTEEPWKDNWAPRPLGMMGFDPFNK